MTSPGPKRGLPPRMLVTVRSSQASSRAQEAWEAVERRSLQLWGDDRIVAAEDREVFSEPPRLRKMTPNPRAVEPPMYVPAVPISASELQATTVAEFLVLLRELAKRSGANRKQLAERSGVPKSTTYYLLNPTTTTLPTKSEQVRNLAVACGLTKDQVDRVMQLWVELRTPSVVAPEAEPEVDEVHDDEANDDEANVDEPHRLIEELWKGFRRWWQHVANRHNFFLTMIGFSIMTMLTVQNSLEQGSSWGSIVKEFTSYPTVVPFVLSLVACLAWMRSFLPNASKPKITLLEKRRRKDKTLYTLEQHTFRDGRMVYVQKFVSPDGTVESITHEV